MTNLEAYSDYAHELSPWLLDPWVAGEPRVARAPYVLTRNEVSELVMTAETLAGVYHELVGLCLRYPEWVRDILRLTPFQQYMWRSSAPLWHLWARFDLFRTENGIVACELNADTPSGQVEAAALSELSVKRHPECLNPNAHLFDHMCSALETCFRAAKSPQAAPCVGIVYPTDLPEDLALIAALAKKLHMRGFRVALGSPQNLRTGPDSAVELLGEPIDILVRHYKTDWWGERQSPWRETSSEDDVDPLVEELSLVLNASADNRLLIANPFGAVVPQNKRVMALMWEKLSHFSPASQQAIRAHIPFSVRLETMDKKLLESEQHAWVIKSAYGCEGDEVFVGRDEPAGQWRDVLANAKDGHWVAQRFFSQSGGKPCEINFGVYVVAGQASGLLLREQFGKTDGKAVTLPALVKA